MAENIKYQKVCGKLIKRPDDYALTIQIARVLTHILAQSNDLEREIEDPIKVVDIFRSKGLIPEKVQNKNNTEKIKDENNEKVQIDLHGEYARLFPQKDHIVVAVCFAACVYPQRVYNLHGQLKLRIECFADFWSEYEAPGSPFEALIRHLSNFQNRIDSSEMRNQLHELIGELSGTDPNVVQDKSDSFSKWRERHNGACFYLGTCHHDLFKRILKNWNNQASLLRCFRSYYSTLPSELGPIKDQVRPQCGGELYDELQKIEKACRYLTRAWPRKLCGRENIQRAWEIIWEKVDSGFPYYAFHSSLKSWIKQCFAHPPPTGQPKNILIESLDEKPWLGDGIKELEPPEQEKPIHSIDLDDLNELRFFREGYRLVRSTFFMIMEPRNHEMLRKAIDVLYKGYLLLKLEAKKDERESLDRIISDLVDCCSV